MSRFLGRCPERVVDKVTGETLVCFDRTPDYFLVHRIGNKDDWCRIKKDLVDIIGTTDFTCESKKCKHITKIVPKTGQIACRCEKCGWNAVDESHFTEDEEDEEPSFNCDICQDEGYTIIGDCEQRCECTDYQDPDKAHDEMKMRQFEE